MNKFSKKYNYKNIKNIKSSIQKNGINTYSTLFPSDQKIHPGCVFSLFFQDLLLHTNTLKGSKINWNLGLGMSSNFYSKLNNGNTDNLQLSSQVVKQGKQNTKFFDKLSLGCNITKNSFVFSEQFNRYIRNVFIDLYTDNKISSQKEITYRSKKLQTNLFKNDIEIKKEEVTEYSIKYFVDSKGHALTIPTTSLETIFADVAVAVNPQDKRYKKLIGKSVIIPIVNKVIPIIGDETIDSFKGLGVFRVTPGHDQFGLDLAKKHNLPTDIFAIDIHGNFTEHAGEFGNKSVKDFFNNIVKFIDDIGNLESKITIKENRNFNRHSGEKIDNIMLNQRNIKYNYELDYLSQKISDDSILVPLADKKQKLLDLINTKQLTNISNKSKKGILIPIVFSDKGDCFPISDKIILDEYKKSKTRKDLSLTLIISNLILDNYLPSSFTIEQLIDVLFSADLKGETTKLEKYIEIYTLESEQLNIKEYRNGLKDIQKLLLKINKDDEKVDFLMNLLEGSFLIKIEDNDLIFDFNTLFGEKDRLALQSEDSFNKSFVDSVWYLYKNDLKYNFSSYENIENIGGELFVCYDQEDFPLNALLLGLSYAKKQIFSSIVFHPILVDSKGDKITNNNSKFLIQNLTENMVNYGPDVMKLTLLFSDVYENNSNRLKFDTSMSQEYHNLLNKIRNASRYVYSNHILESELYKTHKKLNIQDLIEKVASSDNTDYDLWVIHSIKTILDDYDYQLSENNTLELGKKILLFCKDTLCDKYLESTKIYSNTNTSHVVILSFALILRLIKPYIPSFVQEIESIFSIDRGTYNIFDFRDFVLKEKNYKINLLMDIVDKLQNLRSKLGVKKHETVDVFIQANSDFLEFLNENNTLLNSLVNIEKIDSLMLHEELPPGYETDNVININVGIKILKQEEVKLDVLSDMEESRGAKMEYLQHLKLLVASVSHLGNQEIIAQKRKEIFDLQKEIEDIDFEISKLKAR